MNDAKSEMVLVAFMAIFVLVGCLLGALVYVDSVSVQKNSRKDVVCSGMIVLSGSGVVYKDVNTYTLAGKTYQMKDGETCWINDSYVNVEVKQ